MKLIERAFEFGAQSPVDGEAGAGDFGGAVEVENAEFRAELPVRLGREIERRGRADAADFDVIFGGFAGGDGFVGDVGDAGEEVAEFFVQLLAWSSRAEIFSPISRTAN